MPPGGACTRCQLVYNHGVMLLMLGGGVELALP